MRRTSSVNSIILVCGTIKREVYGHGKHEEISVIKYRLEEVLIVI